MQFFLWFVGKSDLVSSYRSRSKHSWVLVHFHVYITITGTKEEVLPEMAWCIKTSPVEKKVRHAARGLFWQINQSRKSVLTRDEYLDAVTAFAKSRLEKSVLTSAGRWPSRTYVSFLYLYNWKSFSFSLILREMFHHRKGVKFGSGNAIRNMSWLKVFLWSVLVSIWNAIFKAYFMADISTVSFCFCIKCCKVFKQIQ